MIIIAGEDWPERQCGWGLTSAGKGLPAAVGTTFSSGVLQSTGRGRVAGFVGSMVEIVYLILVT